MHFDVLHGAANEVIGRLRDLGLDQRGSIVLENVDTSISALADRATARRGRFQEFTPAWAEVEARINMEGTFPPSWFVLLVIAGLISAVGILTNSQILIVGAMVVGPEYGAILSLAFGVTLRDWARARRSAAALAVGFTLAVAGALLLALIIRGVRLDPRAYALGVRPVSNLIDTPNWFSVIVALLAGVVGVVSLTEARSATLIGVFISVTTIPAASTPACRWPSATGARHGVRFCSSCSTSPSSPPSRSPDSPHSVPSGGGTPAGRPQCHPVSNMCRCRASTAQRPGVGHSEEEWSAWWPGL